MFSVSPILTFWSCVLALGIQKSNPASFQEPFLLIMIDSGHILLCISLTSLCRNAKPSVICKISTYDLKNNYLKTIFIHVQYLL